MTEGEGGRWVDGMSEGSVLVAGGGLSFKDRNFLQTANTTRRHKTVGVCVCVCALR